MVRPLQLAHGCCVLGGLAFLSACDGSGPSDDQPALASVTAGATSTCALSDLGQAYCWGSLYAGEPSIERTRPDTIASDLKFRELNSASNIFGSALCGIATDQRGYCWGALLIGYDGGMMIGPAPVVVGENLTLESIAVASRHYCGLTAGGAAYCAGDYRTGVRGTGAPIAEFAEPDLTPNQVAGGLSFTQIAVGLGNSCGLSDGHAYCWGSEIALGTTSAVLHPEEECGYTVLSFTARCSHLPVPVEGNHSFVSLAAGQSHVCGLTVDGAVYCWGTNGAGELGKGHTVYSTTPVQVALGGPATSISLGGNFSCALRTGGRAFCWGQNHVGQVGSGSSVTTVLSPAAVEGGASYRTISAGLNHACAIRTSGELECWGAGDSGQLGTGTRENSAVPLRVQF